MSSPNYKENEVEDICPRCGKPINNGHCSHCQMSLGSESKALANGILPEDLGA